VALHREAWGGEKFFELLDRTSQDPARHIDLLELQYLCLALGFAGKIPNGCAGETRASTKPGTRCSGRFAISAARPPELSLRWKGLQDRRSRLVRYMPWWVVGAMALALLAITFGVYYARLGRAAAPHPY
jgi:type VI secretion system protein ImpK